MTMKRLLTAIALLLTFTASWADSPLTSTHFAEAYSDHEMVQAANELMQNDIPTTLLNFLADKHAPVDVRLAVVNMQRARRNSPRSWMPGRWPCMPMPRR